MNPHKWSARKRQQAGQLVFWLNVLSGFLILLLGTLFLNLLTPTPSPKATPKFSVASTATVGSLRPSPTANAMSRYGASFPSLTLTSIPPQATLTFTPLATTPTALEPSPSATLPPLSTATITAATVTVSSPDKTPPLATPTAVPLNSTQQTALERLNYYRVLAGQPPAHVNAALLHMATSHATYWRLNFGDSHLNGMGLHEEIVGRPGFTAPSITDRSDFWHYQGYVNEDIALIGEPIKAIDAFMGTINHRLPIIDPRYVEIGYGNAVTGTAGIDVLDFGQPADLRGSTAPVPAVLAAWPPDGTKEIGLAYYGEAPNPFPQASFPLGYPVTLKWTGPGTITFSEATLTMNGLTVPSLTALGSGYISANTVLLAAQQPLQPQTKYEVAIKGTVNNQPYDLHWSFTTAANP